MDNHLPISVNKLDVAELKTGSHQAVQLQVGKANQASRLARAEIKARATKISQFYKTK